MRASVINRIAKISVPAARRTDTTWVRRLAATVPLAAVVAVGAVACGPAKGTDSTQAAAANVTATPSAAIPGAGVSAVPSAAPSTPAAPATSAAPTTGTTSTTGTTQQTGTGSTKAPAAPAAATTPAAPTQHDVSVQINGLSQTLAVGATQSTAFSVTWTNTTGHRLDAVAPVVSSEHYEGAHCKETSEAQGTLKRHDASGWTTLPALSQGTGIDYAATGDKVAFALAPGASRTIDYQVQLGADNDPGVLMIEADAFIPNPVAHPLRLGQAVQGVQVTDAHRPTAGMGLLGHAPSITAGGDALELQVAPGNFTNSPMQTLAPELLFSDVNKDLRPQDFSVEVMVDNAWKKLPVGYDCRGLSVDTSSIATNGAATNRVYNYLFRVSLNTSAPMDATSISMSAGALGDGHYAALQATQVSVVR
jgi:hypothetical protein